ncbi:hypothetical protein [Albibacterium sp.]|uniref:hypothetical protein n=1 Tax=Albibacterium sp. TaxID=2952885 RepID=UPI002CB1EC2E|nr:hypothetical protein [Albibacterium sp.]HUH19671.1 hypothetical protein [Albibacterium sp.]
MEKKPLVPNSQQTSDLKFSVHQLLGYVNFWKNHSRYLTRNGRALDNVYIEQFWRTIKYQHIHLFPATDGISLYIGIKEWLNKYHYKAHQGIARNKPSEMYLKAA